MRRFTAQLACAGLLGAGLGGVSQASAEAPQEHLAVHQVVKPPVLPAAAHTAGAPVLRKGSKGPYVRILQHMLNGRDSNICPIWEPCRADYRVVEDAIFGPDTESAVRKFQAQELLGIDGIVGPKTWARLKNPRPRCEAARQALVDAGASVWEVGFGVDVARRESQCSLAQIVYRPSTGDHSYSAWGINLLGPLAARVDPESKSYIAPRWTLTASWGWSARAFLKMLRKSGACHWQKVNPKTGNPYCS